MTAGPHRSAADREAWDLIPWVVGGTASAADRARVERHVAVCADCAAELAFQRNVHSALAATLDAAPVDPEPGLQRMMARIDGEEAVLDAGGRRRAVRSRWLAVAAAVVAVQAVALVVLGGRAAHPPTADAYATLSRPETGRATVRLVPAPSMSLQEFQALLGRHDLQIVDAGADGAMFGLAPRHPVSAAASAALLPALRATPGVLLAEPIVGAGDSAQARP